MALYDFIDKFGSSGSGDGQFNQGWYLDVDSSFIYVIERGNNRVQIFNKTSPYAFVAKFGTVGVGDGEFIQPQGIAVDDNFIYVADTGFNRVQIFNKTSPYAFVAKIEKSGGGSGSGDGEFNNPQGIVVDDNFIYVTEVGNNRVQILNKTSPYSFVGKFGSIGSGDGQFSQPRGIAINGSFIYVVDGNNHRVQKFNKTSPYSFVGKFGSIGIGDGQFNQPKGIDIDDNSIYVVDGNNHRVQIFDISAFTFIAKIEKSGGGSGAGDGEFNAPQGIIVEPGFIYVADGNNSRIQIFEGAAVAVVVGRRRRVLTRSA